MKKIVKSNVANLKLSKKHKKTAPPKNKEVIEPEIIEDKVPSAVNLTEVEKIANDIDFTFTEDVNINNFLKIKTVELLNTQGKAYIEFGRIYQEVYDKLGGDNHHNGLYTKWLIANEISPKTAHRYRDRYKLYKKMKTDSAKTIIATIPHRVILSVLNSKEKKVSIINSLNRTDEGMTREQLLEMFSQVKPKKIENKPNDIELAYKEFKEKYSHFNLEKIPSKKQEKANLLLAKVNKLLEQLEKLEEK